MAGYGATWNTAAQCAADGIFYLKTALTDALHVLGNKNFSVVEQRQAAFEVWDKIKVERPVSRKIQFPEDQTYVAIELCDFHKIEAQLQKAMAFKESAKHRNEPKEPSKSGSSFKINKETEHIEGVLINFAPMDDAMTAFYEAIKSLKDIAASTNCTYDRASFEKKFGLTWQKAG